MINILFGTGVIQDKKIISKSKWEMVGQTPREVFKVSFENGFMSAKHKSNSFQQLCFHGGKEHRCKENHRHWDSAVLKERRVNFLENILCKILDKRD